MISLLQPEGNQMPGNGAGSIPTTAATGSSTTTLRVAARGWQWVVAWRYCCRNWTEGVGRVGKAAVNADDLAA